MNESGDFHILLPDQNYIRFNLKDCDKLSKFGDSSWEIKHKSGEQFQFFSENPDDNNTWYFTVNEVFVQQALDLPTKPIVPTTPQETILLKQNESYNHYGLSIIFNNFFLNLLSKFEY